MTRLEFDALDIEANGMTINQSHHLLAIRKERVRDIVTQEQIAELGSPMIEQYPIEVLYNQ
jgi:hypothetical protein